MPTIISPLNRIAFLHIPKCGGSSVGYQLAAALPCTRYFLQTGFVAHPALGPILPSHLPLWALRDHFPDSFAALGRCRTFALTRAPRARFASALGQHARQFLGRDLDSLAETELRRLIAEIETAFGAGLQALLHRFVHFIPQAAFIRLDGQEIAREVYPLEALPAFACAVSEAAGVAIDGHERLNASNRYRGAGIAATIARLKPVARRMLPPRLFAATRGAVLSLATRPPPAHLARVLGAPEVTGFLDRVYAEDALLHARASARLAAAA